MNITWYGQTCFRIITQKIKNNHSNDSVNILIDPFEKNNGLSSSKTASDILLITHDNKKGVDKPSCAIKRKNVNQSPFLITGPGEYDLKGVYVQGFSASSENTAYIIEVEDIKICHLGLISQGELSSDQLEKINEVDILMIPIGGQESIDAKGAIKIMSQIEPKVIIPMYYKTGKLKAKLDNLDSFLKALGIKSLQPMPKLSIKKKDLSGEEVKIIALSS